MRLVSLAEWRFSFSLVRPWNSVPSLETPHPASSISNVYRVLRVSLTRRVQSHPVSFISVSAARRLERTILPHLFSLSFLGDFSPFWSCAPARSTRFHAVDPSLFGRASHRSRGSLRLAPLSPSGPPNPSFFRQFRQSSPCAGCKRGLPGGITLFPVPSECSQPTLPPGEFVGYLYRGLGGSPCDFLHSWYTLYDLTKTWVFVVC